MMRHPAPHERPRGLSGFHNPGSVLWPLAIIAGGVLTLIILEIACS